MALLALEEMVKPLTAAEIKAAIYKVLSGMDLDTTSWRPGAATRTLIAVCSVVLSWLSVVVSLIAKMGFLEYAEGEWLRLRALLVYGVVQTEATFAAGNLTLDNGGGGIYGPFDAGEVVAQCTATGKTYVNTEAFSLGALETGKVVAFRAEEAGVASSASAGQIDYLVTTMLGVTVTNSADFVGTDQESREDVAARCTASLGALSPNGPKAAYEYVCTTPALNGNVPVNRVRVLDPPGDGTLTVVIAGAAGELTGPEVTLVQTGVDDTATPDIATVTVESATAVPFTTTVDLYVSTAAGLTDQDWDDLVRPQLLAFVPTIPIGGVPLTEGGPGAMRMSALRSLAQRPLGADGKLHAAAAYVLQAAIADADVALDETEIGTLDDGDLTINVNQVSP